MSEKPKSSSEGFESATQLRGVLDEVKLIAKGGMAEIFRARQPALGRYIVVKKLRDDLLKNTETLERFRREARALASVLHQNVAHVYDFVETPSESFILMEFIEGVDVSTVVQKVGQIPADVAALILLGVAKGVSYIHTHHLIHRDIKPSNIRITTHGEIKLMDFGIVVDTENEGLTRPGMMVGSPSYLSPEQVLGDPITPSADIFLLGICFYEMLTGTRPFKEENGETVFQRIREGKYVPATKMNGRIPLALDRIVRRCLERDPNKRFKDVKALIEAVGEYLGTLKTSHAEDCILQFLDEEALLRPAVPYQPLVEETKARAPMSRKSVLVVAGAILLALALGIWIGRETMTSRGLVLEPTARPIKK